MVHQVFTHKNLTPGQWQLGDIVFGTGTNIKIKDVDEKAYDINAQDYQVNRSNETRFGFDYLKPTTINLTLAVLHNRLLPQFANTIPNFWHNMPTVRDIATEWRGDDVREVWGQLKPLFVCSKLDNIVKMIVGRPGQFSHSVMDEWNNGEVVEFMGEFRRADTIAYSADEKSAPLGSTIVPAGDAVDVWCRVLSYSQSVTVGGRTLTVSGGGGLIEFNSYPWERRVVDSGGTNLSSSIDGYLDKFVIPAGGASTSGVGTIFWRDGYSVI